ncbi:hypothetical protein ACS0TY_017981 [Phlomoides rotata]
MIMQLSLSTRSCLQIPTINNQVSRRQAPPKDKVVVVVGATGTGKSRLSIDLATSFPAEVINSDKMQVYQGLDITTNKLSEEERRGVHHHLFDVFDPESDYSTADFRSTASLSLQLIRNREKLPIIVGGSNSFIEALVDEKFRQKYECCFLWVDAAPPVHQAALSSRVDKMVERGMVEEVREFFHPNGDYIKGVRRSIGVPEFDRFFRVESVSDEATRREILAEAIDKVKMNTIKLACRQREKICRLRNVKGWMMLHLDSTEALRRRGGDTAEVWEELVMGPSVAAVKRFLYELQWF